MPTKKAVIVVDATDGVTEREHQADKFGRR
jgi:hypothetical protein